jgi:hypothetical protein
MTRTRAAVRCCIDPPQSVFPRRATAWKRLRDLAAPRCDTRLATSHDWSAAELFGEDWLQHTCAGAAERLSTSKCLTPPLVCAGLVLFSGLMSGLTLGLLSLDAVELEVLRRSGTRQQKVLRTLLLAAPASPTLARSLSRSRPSSCRPQAVCACARRRRSFAREGADSPPPPASGSSGGAGAPPPGVTARYERSRYGGAFFVLFLAPFSTPLTLKRASLA